jgi:predicted transport protein
MPIFEITNQRLVSIEQTNFSSEKVLQSLIEKNLETVFNCRFVASEFSTGAQHAGRTDTLALSEDNNPVIIEYKRVESSELINQSLFYLSWIHDHRGDFEIAVRKVLGNKVEVDWTDIRVICIAPDYKRYDVHAVKLMGVNIELWRYRFYKNSSLYLEQVFQTPYISTSEEVKNGKNPVMVAAGKKAAITRITATYTFEEHLVDKPNLIKELVLSIQEFILSLGSSIEEVPKKFYIAYKISQNIVCMKAEKKRVILYLKLDPKKIKNPPKISRDMTDVGHWGTGDFELTITSQQDFETAKPFIEIAYQKIGG